MAATELGTAYVSIVAETSKLEAGIKSALQGGGKQADLIGRDIGSKISTSASKALKDGWRPDQDIMAGIPNTKLDRIGARMGQVIGKGVSAGLKAHDAGVKFGNSFAQGAGSVGLGRVISGWRSELSGGALNSIGMLAGKSLSLGLTAAAGVAVGGIGLALTKGFDRLQKIDAAKAKLKAMKMSTQEVADTVKLVTDSVTGTPFSLDAAFGTATMAIGAGVKDIKRFMTDVADAAGFAGVDLDRMGVIFTQIQAKGKLTGEEMMQLMEAGLPAKSWIEKSYNLTAEQFDKMQKDGQITMEMLQTSIEANAGGMAKNAGTTLQGAIDNMQTSIARIGANFLSAIFGGATGDETEGMKDAINKITEKLNQLDGWIKAHREDIKQFFNDAKDAAKNVVGVIGEILDTINDIPGGITTVVLAFGAWKAIEGVLTVATALKSLSTLLAVTLPANAAIAGAGIAAGLSAALPVVAQILAAWQLGNTNPAFNLQPGQTAPDGSMIATGPDGRPVILDRNGNPAHGALIDAPPGLPNVGSQQRQRRGLPPIDPTGGILGGVLGGGGGLLPGPYGSMPTQGGGGRGFMNYGAASAQLDRQAIDSALLANVPAGVYSQSGASDLTQGLADCSSAVEDLVNILDGQSTSGRSMSTDNAAQWLTSRGFMPGTAPGAFNVGYNSTHMQATLPGGTPFNWGSNAAAARGGVGGSGAFDPAFTSHYYRYAGGGGVRGAGSSTSDSIPAMLSNGEHVLNAKDVGAMGGQSGVYAFRNALHRADGGAIQKLEDMRTAGAIPAAAGSTAKAGDSAIAKGISMGGEFINGLIDQAASAAATAGNLGAMAASGGSSGPAGGMATQFAIGAATNAAKRGVTWGADMLGIGADALLQQLTPFGMPRWLTQDYSGFMPQWDAQGALGNLMTQGAAGSPVDPNTTTHGEGQGVAPGPSAMGPAELAPPPDMFQNSANSFLSTELQQVNAPAPDAQPVYKIDNVYTQDVDSMGRELAKQGRLASMQYTGRPGP